MRVGVLIASCVTSLLIGLGEKQYPSEAAATDESERKFEKLVQRER